MSLDEAGANGLASAEKRQQLQAILQSKDNRRHSQNPLLGSRGMEATPNSKLKEREVGEEEEKATSQDCLRGLFCPGSKIELKTGGQHFPRNHLEFPSS